jgi:hypothetical protein
MKMKDFPAAILAYLRQCTAAQTEGAICKAVDLKLFRARPYIDTLAAAGLAVIHPPSYRDTSRHVVTYSATRPKVAGIMTGLHGVSLRHTAARHMEAAGVAPQTSGAVGALTKASAAYSAFAARRHAYREDFLGAIDDRSPHAVDEDWHGAGSRI